MVHTMDDEPPTHPLKRFSLLPFLSFHAVYSLIHPSSSLLPKHFPSPFIFFSFLLSLYSTVPTRFARTDSSPILCLVWTLTPPFRPSLSSISIIFYLATSTSSLNFPSHSPVDSTTISSLPQCTHPNSDTTCLNFSIERNALFAI